MTRSPKRGSKEPAADSAPRFAGFPKEALRFYADLANHNDRDWFEAHREDYETSVIQPAQALVEALGARLQAAFPAVGYSANHTGKGSIKKIHTDQRYQKDRPPFKTYCQIIFWEGPLSAKKSNSCFGIHIDPERVSLTAGLKYFEGPHLKAFRESVAESKGLGPELGKIAGDLEAAGYSIMGEHYKSVPKGYPSDHPRARLLRHDAIYAERETTPVPKALFSSDFLDFCYQAFVEMRPLQAWGAKFLAEAEARP